MSDHPVPSSSKQQLSTNSSHKERAHDYGYYQPPRELEQFAPYTYYSQLGHTRYPPPPAQRYMVAYDTDDDSVAAAGGGHDQPKSIQSPRPGPSLGPVTSWAPTTSFYGPPIEQKIEFSIERLARQVGVPMAGIHDPLMPIMMLLPDTPVASYLRLPNGRPRESISFRIAWQAYPEIEFAREIPLAKFDGPDKVSITRLDLARAVVDTYRDFQAACQTQRPKPGLEPWSFAPDGLTYKELYLVSIYSPDGDCFVANINFVADPDNTASYLIHFGHYAQAFPGLGADALPVPALMRFDLAGRFQTPQKVLQWSKVSHISFWAHRSKLCSSRIKLGISSCSVLTFQRDLSSHIRLLFSCHDMSHITQLDKYYIRGDTNLELRPIKDIESRTPHGCNEEHPRHQESLPRLMMLLNLHVDPMVRVPQPTMDPARGVPLENFAWMRSDSIPKGLTWLDNQRVEFDLHGLPRGTGICLGLLQDKTVPEIAPHVVDVQKPVILPTHTGANYQQIVITFWWPAYPRTSRNFRAPVTIRRNNSAMHTITRAGLLLQLVGVFNAFVELTKTEIPYPAAREWALLGRNGLTLDQLWIVSLYQMSGPVFRLDIHAARPPVHPS
ncbi:hypothetical protein IEO21_09190 [Rhodonia placenta]|uniref:Uncharacterized protein n=1 Tax=Rhodonia placenta TaxID=104341 RepID=A0A8H7TYP4_9APHY|nr:hypothetical protein IEO21_09190 [Postia placenta]